MKRRLCETQVQGRDEQLVKQLANEIIVEREKKRRLEWYLSEVLKEKEQLMRDNSRLMKSLDITTSLVEAPQMPCMADEYLSPSLRDGATSSSPLCSEEGLHSATLCSNTTPPLHLPPETTEELCCGTAPKATLLRGKCEPRDGSRHVSYQRTSAFSTTSLFLDRPSYEPSNHMWLVEPPVTVANTTSYNSCAQELEVEKVEQCQLDLDMGWLAKTDEQDLISTLQEYFS